MKFEEIFKGKIAAKASAHARVNLIGEHTDYTGGFVMPTLLENKITIKISETKNKEFQIYSSIYSNKVTFCDFIKSKTNDWTDYIKGCLFVFFDENKNIPIKYFNIHIHSDIPMERGISSSSALCVATIKVLNKYFNTDISYKHIAIMAQKVERDYIGVSGGIMDQMVSAIGIKRKAFFLDCLSLKYQFLDIPSNWKFCLVDSKVQRNLRDSSYNERYNQLKKAEEEIGVEYLGSVKLKDFNENNFSSHIVYKRAKHVVSENKRVLDAKESILENDIKTFGRLMNESHKSYSNDFEASTKDVDIITKRSINSGAEGSRLTGGGFGGFTVSLIKKNNYDVWYDTMIKYYSKDKIFEV